MRRMAVPEENCRKDRSFMEIREFQKRLAEVVELGKYNGKHLKTELVEHLFKDEGLTKEQMEQVCQYLSAQGIRVGEEYQEPEARGGFRFEEQRVPDELSAEEERYLEECRNTCAEAAANWLKQETDPERGRAKLLERAACGDAEAVGVLAALYADEVVRAVRELHRKEIFAGDSFQEGNLGLMTALASLEGEPDPHGYICRSIRSAIRAMMEEYQEQKWEDACLVDRVEQLEQAIRELADSAGDKFSVEELSAFLDMGVEEIQDILRLTGEND